MAISNSLSTNRLAKTSTAASTNNIERFFRHPVQDRQLSDSEGKSWQMVFFGPFLRAFRALQQYRLERETCHYLMSLDDCHLDDIGINRADVVMAMRKQNLLSSATEELNKMADGNRKSLTRESKG